jgi:hypothetical protein
MTDSDDLRGDPNHDPTRRHHPELRELDNLRALLRPRMTEEGDPTPTDALRGMFIEIERLRANDENLYQTLKNKLEATRQTLQLLRGRLHEALSISMDGASDKDIFERIKQLSTAQTTIRAHDLKHIESLGQRVRDLERQIQQEREQDHAGAQAVAERLRNIMSTCFGGSRSGDLYFQLADMEKWIPKFASEWSANHGRWHELCQRLGLSAHIDDLAAVLKHIENSRASDGRRRPMDAAIIADNEAALARLADTIEFERKLASAAATGHDHARGLLVAIAEVFGRVDDLDSLPAKVRELSDNCLHNCTKAERLQASIAATERRRLEADLVAMTTAIGNAAKDVGVLCEGRAAVDILPDLLGLMKSRVRRAAEMDERRAKWAHEFSAQAQAEAQADSVAFVREHEIKAARWTKICEAFGFDPEQDPPVSIPAILVGNRWTNTRRMLADACAKLQAPSLEMVLGELIQALNEARQAARAMGHGQTEARRLTDERIDALQKHVGDLAEALDEKTAALDAVPAQLAALRDTADAAHAAMKQLGWDGSTYPDEWATACLTSNVHFSEEVRTLREKVGVLEAQLAAASEDTNEIEAAREALGVPAGKTLMTYVVHAAKGMQALAILGWQDGPPVEWATKRAAAEADLRGAFAEAELVGSDHAAMVRELWGNLRSLSERAEARRDWAVADLERVNRDFRDALGILGWQGPMSSGPAKVWAATMAPLADLQRRLDLVVGDRDSAIALNRIYRESLEALGCKTNADDLSILPWAKARAHEHDATVRELGSMNAELCAAMDSWRKWAIGKGVDITDSLTSDEIRTILDMHEQESRRLTNDRIDGLQVMIGERDEQIESLKAELRPVLDLRIRIDEQEHALAELTRELKLASDHRMGIHAARRGEVTAFGDALRELPWKEWIPRDFCSPIGMFRDLIAEIARRHKLSP